MEKMKKHNLSILVFSVLVCILTGFYSCDYISNPIGPVPPPSDTCETVPFPATKPFRKVMVEDYTGHKCNNCPQAAISAHHLEEIFHDSVIIVAVHAGDFAKPTTTGTYVRNFQTVAGEIYNSKFAFQGYPNGLVNRKGSPSNFIKSHSSWAGEVNSILRTPIEADIKMIADYNTNDSMVCVNIQTTFLKTTPVGMEYSLCLMLLQDSIIAPQLNGSNIQLDYIHRHVLRANINGEWGEKISKDKPVVVNEPIASRYKFKLNADYGYEGKTTPKGQRIPCERKNCYLVAFVYEAGSPGVNPSYRILQAEEVKIIK
jgi:hypothetical protein